MTESHKALVFMVVGDDSRAFALVHSLERLARRDEIYSWFIRNDITGKKFIEFVQERKGSLVSIRNDVLTRIDGKKPGPMILGRDFF